MQIEFVNHSSLIYRSGPISLLCDPWLFGTAFDDSWALLSESKFEPEDCAGVTHLWFSHEHPDHFSPATLKAIPQEVRSKITVLFHQSNDRKVLEYCKGLGFGELIELGDCAPVQLSEGFEVMCGRYGQDDSWLLVSTPDCKLLNLNDCQLTSIDEATALKRVVGEVDVLLTQFSISSWDGNINDLPRRLAGAQAMLDRAAMQTRVFSADYLIPFASFIWFCHEENDYMNQALPDPQKTYDFFVANTDATPVVMYPGDTWDVGQAFDSQPAIERYTADVSSLSSRPRVSTETVPIDTLIEMAKPFIAAVRAEYSPLRFRLRELKMNVRHLRHAKRGIAPWLRALPYLARLQVLPSRLWLTDLQQSVDFSVSTGLEPSDRKRKDCDVELSSGALRSAFRFLWGGETLQINGRFNEIYPEGRLPFFEYLWIACALNREAGATARPL